MRPDPPLPRHFTRAQALARGLTDRQIAQRVDSGRWARIRPGQYLLAAAEVDDPKTQAIAAFETVRRRGAVLSHTTAAQLFALPEPLDGWGLPTFTVPSGPGWIRHGVHVRSAPLPPQDVVVAEGVRVTSPARTVVDCLRVLPPRDGLAVADAALHRGLVVPADLGDAVDRQEGWPGAPRARELLAVADPRRESPLESWTAWAFDQAGVPAPQWQITLRTRGGRFVARADCWWLEGVVGEADGRAKSAMAAADRGGPTSQAFVSVLEAERAREQDIRGLGADVIRWPSVQILRAAALPDLAARIRRDLSAAALLGRFTGLARYEGGS